MQYAPNLYGFIFASDSFGLKDSEFYIQRDCMHQFGKNGEGIMEVSLSVTNKHAISCLKKLNSCRKLMGCKWKKCILHYIITLKDFKLLVCSYVNNCLFFFHVIIGIRLPSSGQPKNEVSLKVAGHFCRTGQNLTNSEDVFFFLFTFRSKTKWR